jgi:hypothetical protein
LRHPRSGLGRLRLWASAVVLLAMSHLSALADADLVKQGEYLARAGDCIACNTTPGGPLFAGGRAMPTPFGTLYSSNITPDPATGIGKWTADQFYALMHTGRSPDGGLIYPALLHQGHAPGFIRSSRSNRGDAVSARQANELRSAPLN